MANKFAIITGGSTGIGAELVKLAFEDGYDILAAADTPFASVPPGVETLDVDLSTLDGVDQLLAKAAGRQIDLLCANAGHGLGHAFLDQKVEDWRHIIDTNITGTIYLLHKVLPAMVQRNDGKVLVTGSIAGYIPGSFQAVYNASKSFVQSFAEALRNELKDTGVSITALMPGPTDTNFFHRAEMDDTKVGAGEKADPADVAKDGYEAMKKGEDKVVSGWKNKLEAAMTNVVSDSMLAEQHRKEAAPGTAHH